MRAIAAAAAPLRFPFAIETFGGTLAERCLGLPALNALYADISARAGAGFCERALAALDVRMNVEVTDLARIPAAGPLVVVGNHPFGGVDGLALAALLRRVRPDVKILGNKLLSAVPDLREMLLGVNAFGDGAEENVAPLRQAVRWVRDGGALTVFPAGEVSHLHIGSRAVMDGTWNPAAARIAMMTGATVIPMHFDGRNSAMFQIAGLVHRRLRTALLPRELLKRRGSTIRVFVGSGVSPERLQRFETAEEATHYLRLRSSVLSGRGKPTAQARHSTQRIVASLAMTGDARAIASEIASFPSQALLARGKQYQVFVASAEHIPATLREIGRLREATFRLVGEGTGDSLDIDRFDQHYRHLFVWDTREKQIVGAYRLGLTDEIIPRFGSEGLYTSTLFRFRPELLEQLTPAIELGRSFVRIEYQKEYLPLMLLWKGIGRFVAREPKYRLLFGPVSISSDYASLTKQILIRFLECNARMAGLASLLVPRNPPRFGPPRGAASDVINSRIVGSIEEVDELVAEIEDDRRRVPVLLRQYLKLGAKLLGFNVDPEFGDVLDGLMLVDLADVEPAILGRYMGVENVQSFQAFHHVTR